MTETGTQEALAAAREALRQAQEALRLAEQAAGVSADATEGTAFDEITVKRINVVEGDGRLRLIIGNSTVGDTVPLRGEHHPHPGRARAAGMLFVNDEGTECGGLIFGGRSATGDAPEEQTVSLTFDDFEQDAGIQMALYREGGTRQRAIEFSDRPDWSLVDLIREYNAAESDDARAAVIAAYPEPRVSRVLLTRDTDGDAVLVLRDGQGRDRLRFVVPADGDPRAEVVAPDGTARSLLPEG